MGLPDKYLNTSNPFYTSMKEDSLSFIKRAKFRKKLFFELQISRSAKNLAKSLQRSRSQVHRALDELINEDLVTSPHDKGIKGTGFKLTPKGEKVIHILLESESKLPYSQLMSLVRRVRTHLIEGEYNFALSLINEHVKGQMDLTCPR